MVNFELGSHDSEVGELDYGFYLVFHLPVFGFVFLGLCLISIGVVPDMILVLALVRFYPFGIPLNFCNQILYT